MDGEQTTSHAGLYAALAAFAFFMLLAVGSYAAFEKRGGGEVYDRDASDVFVVMPGRHTKEVSGKVEMSTFFENERFASHSPDLHHAEVVAIMGHSTLDLSGTQLAGGGGTIEAVALCGRTDIIVPRDWTVKTKDYLVLGAVRDPDENPPASAKVVQLEAVAILGSVNVTH